MLDLSHLCPVTVPGDPSTYAGWLGNDENNQRIAASLPQVATADFLLATEPTQPILLYKAWTDVLGKQPDYPAQQIGDCVSFGHAHANDLLQCVEIAFGEPSEFRETDTEFIYGESRKVGHILGIFDGSYGSAAAKAMTTVGNVSREMLGGEGSYSGSRAKSWGRTGPPSSVEALAAPFKLGAVAKITTREAAISCLWNGSPFTICSNQGFTMTRDSTGACRASGHWGHCMFVCAWRPNPEGFLICQSWGPTTPGGPLVMDQPTFSFWCDPQTMVRNILGAGDSWGLFRSPDFVKRPIPTDWTVA